MSRQSEIPADVRATAHDIFSKVKAGLANEHAIANALMDARAFGRSALMTEVRDAQPSTIESTDKGDYGDYERGRCDGIMEYARALAELDDGATNCLWCGKIIRIGDLCEHGGGMSDGEIACEACASTYADMLVEPGSFVRDDSGEETVYHTAETARQAAAKHLAAGGALTDKLVTPY